MQFDPTKPFGTIHGNSSEFPEARYSQNNFLYSGRHKCLNPTEAKDKSAADLVASATKDLLETKQVELEAATDALVATQKAMDEDPSAANKAKNTKARNKYESMLEEIANLGG